MAAVQHIWQAFRASSGGKHPLQTIMVATDFSERSDRAMRRATLMAKQFESDVTLVHVVDDDQPAYIVQGEREQAKDLLRKMADTMRKVDRVACDARVIVSSPFAGIVQAVDVVAPDLLIIGPHRRQVLKDAFVGTTAERAIRSVSCPILMANAPPASNYRHVLQTTDLSEVSGDAIRRFSSLGIGRAAQNSVLYVFDVPELQMARLETPSKKEREFYLKEQRKEAARELADFLRTAGSINPEMVLRHQASTVAQEILGAADEEMADLIVISTHGRGGLAKLFLGSVAEQVLAQATTDVLAVPPLRN